MKEETKIKIAEIVTVAFIASFLGVTVFYVAEWQSQQTPTTQYIITLNSHQAAIVVDNGNWTAIVPNPNGNPFEFHSSNYTEVIQWAMNQTQLP